MILETVAYELIPIQKLNLICQAEDSAALSRWIKRIAEEQ